MDATCSGLVSGRYTIKYEYAGKNLTSWSVRISQMFGARYACRKRYLFSYDSFDTIRHRNAALFLDIAPDDLGSNGLGLALKPRSPLGVSGNFGSQHLHRHIALQSRVRGPVHLAHAACPQLSAADSAASGIPPCSEVGSGEVEWVDSGRMRRHPEVN